MQGPRNRRSTQEHGADTLAAMDHVLAGGGQSVQAAAQAMTVCLVRLRDALIEIRRENAAEGVSQQLAHANAVLSLVFSIQYPLEGEPREKLRQARSELAKLLAETRRL